MEHTVTAKYLSQYLKTSGSTIIRTLEEISAKKGTSYDSGVVDACLTLFQKKGFKFE